MTDLIQVLIIAVAQGIGEFLPISSSGHNALINRLFEMFGNPLTKDGAEFLKLNILLHLGSLIAVLIVFRHRIAGLFVKERRLILMLGIASIPIAVVGLPIYMYAPWTQNNMPLVSACFLVTGLMLLLTLRFPEGKMLTSTMTCKQAFFIGCAQGLAVLPGISRLGATFAAGLWCGLNREEATAFSFILSIPVIVGSGMATCINMLRESPLTDGGTLPGGLLLLGATVSCMAGIVTLLFFLDWVKKDKLWYFAIWVFAGWVFLMSPITLLLA